MTQQATVLGSCDHCGETVLTAENGVSFAELGNGEINENNALVWYHYRCMNPYAVGDYLFRSWVIVMLELVNRRVTGHEDEAHVSPASLEVPKSLLYVPN